MADEEKKKRGIPVEVLPGKHVMPLMGLGTYKLQDEQILTNLLRKGLQFGFCKHIDTARLYNNEIQLGRAIQTVIKEERVKRNELFIATKIFNHKATVPVAQIKEALELMQLKYFDLVYLHWPIADLSVGINHLSLEQIWEMMELCVQKGYTKQLGVCNFNGQLLLQLLAIAKIKPAVLQVEVHPYLQNNGLVELAQKNKIVVMAHTPLARGDNLDRDSVNLLKDEVILEIANKHGRTPAQVVLKNTLQRGVGVLPKTESVSRVVQNGESWSVELGEDDLKKIRGINRMYRVCDGKSLFKECPMFD